MLKTHINFQLFVHFEKYFVDIDVNFYFIEIVVYITNNLLLPIRQTSEIKFATRSWRVNFKYFH